MRPNRFSPLLLLFSLAGCIGSHNMVQPRSEVIAEAKAKGIAVPSVEEDKVFFFSNDKQNQDRLVELLKNRMEHEVADNSYVIGFGDDIEIAVFDVPELNTTVKVKGSGIIDLPLVGPVQASGKTEAGLLADLKQKMRVFVRNPQINVFVSHYGSQKVSVLGAVQKPGTYSLRKGTNSIMELIGSAGGATEKAGNFVNFIPAEENPNQGGISAGDIEARARLSLGDSSVAGGKAPRGFEIYIDQILGTNGGLPLDIPVRAGDMIIVPDGGNVMVEGEVEHPGPSPVQQHTTLLSVLAAAGGITYGAKIDEVEIIRDIGERKVHLVMNLEDLARGEAKDVRLRNGDIVRVPSDSGRRLKQDTFESISKIFNFGVGGTVPIR